MNMTYITSTIAAVAIMVFAISPTVLTLITMINSRQKPANPKIKFLEETDAAIADQTNEGFNLIAQSIDALEASFIELSNERSEVSGFVKK